MNKTTTKVSLCLHDTIVSGIGKVLGKPYSCCVITGPFSEVDPAWQQTAPSLLLTLLWYSRSNDSLHMVLFRVFLPSSTSHSCHLPFLVPGFHSCPFVCQLCPFFGHRLESKYKKEKAKHISVEIPKETDVIAVQKWFQ
jgi:hypothetical protein